MLVDSHLDSISRLNFLAVIEDVRRLSLKF